MIHSSVFVPQRIFLVGGGGVGSRLCAELAFFVRGNFSDLGNTVTTIIDHDHVAPRNLNRQLYYPHEVGNKSKGQILVDRYRDLFRVDQIPEAINAETITRIFDEDTLQRKILVICAADNGLVVKQTFEHIIQNAQNDYLVMFTGANLRTNEIAGQEVQTGSGQAFAYGVVNGTPLFPAPPTETLMDIMTLTGFGPSVSGRNCGVDDTSGAQTPLMNQSCACATMTILNFFFEKGIFIPSIYFTDGIEFTFADHIVVEQLQDTQVPETLLEDAEEELPTETSEIVEAIDELAEAIEEEASDEAQAVPA